MTQWECSFCHIAIRGTEGEIMDRGYSRIRVRIGRGKTAKELKLVSCPLHNKELVAKFDEFMKQVNPSAR